MSRQKLNLHCYLIISASIEYSLVTRVLKQVLKEVGIKLSLSEETSESFNLVPEIAKSDLVIAEVSQSNNSNIFYEIGIANAMGKPIILLKEELSDNISFEPLGSHIQSNPLIQYTNNKKGLEVLRKKIFRLITEFKKSPRRFTPSYPYQTRLLTQPFIIDLEKLNPREFENLCFELLRQMGFRGLKWEKDTVGIDATAIFPKKDPDNYEYNELWLISMGRRVPIEDMLEMVVFDQEFFFNRHLRNYAKLFNEISNTSGPDGSITLLLIQWKEKGPSVEIIEHEIRRMEMKIKEQSSPFKIRIRLWDLHYLMNLILQYPQIGYKYFSDEARTRSEYRKTPEELYLENVKLTEKSQATLSQLEEEKKKRFIAERNAAWKDVAFKAAHKLGNPIDAVETYLQSIKKRMEKIDNEDANQVNQIIKDMDISIEEAKSVIAQFKSLTKSQEINLRPTEILHLIEHSCQIAKENGIEVETYFPEKCPPLMLDPDRISECFNELVVNALHWLNKVDKKIKVTVEKASKEEIPDNVDVTNDYLKIKCEDNGLGIELKNKENIFAPFVTTYPHGTGLGLSLVKWIIEGHGGTVYENGKLGEGASFVILLPIVKYEGK